MSSNRAWKATLPNGLKVEIDYTHDTEQLDMYIGVDDYGWDECPIVDDRSTNYAIGEGLTVNRIWVARLHDKSEILVNYWQQDDRIDIAYRGISWHTWGAPVTAEEIPVHTGDN